jgi:hypothetical protein
MRASAWVVAAAIAALATGAVAETKVVPTVSIATAAWSTQPNTLAIKATVQLNDACWTNPRFMPPLTGAKPPAGEVAPIEVVADYATGKICAQVVRTVAVPTLNWRIYPNPKLTGVKIIGSVHPVTVVIRKR